MCWNGGANVAPAQYEFGAPQLRGAWSSAQAAYTGSLTNSIHRLFDGPATNAYGLANGEAVIADDGTRGFVTRAASLVVIDRNDNGMYDVGDMTFSAGAWAYVVSTYTRTAEAYNYGGSYVRWAHMAWCR